MFLFFRANCVSGFFTSGRKGHVSARRNKSRPGGKDRRGHPNDTLAACRKPECVNISSH